MVNRKSLDIGYGHSAQELSGAAGEPVIPRDTETLHTSFS